MNNKKGRLIVIEGACDGIGKSTQLEMLKKEFGSDCYTHHFPSYGFASANMVNLFLKKKLGDLKDIPDEAAELYYAIDREYVWRNYLKKEIDEGKTVILDRYTTSSFIYQTLKCQDEDAKKDMIAQIQALEYGYLKIGDPDLVIFLNGDFATVTRLRLARTDNAGFQKDIFEAKTETQRQLYENAQFVSNYLKWYQVVVTENDNMRSEEAIHEDIMRLVRKK